MTTFRRALSLSLLSGATLFAAIAPAHAADFAYRTTLDAVSRRGGIGRASVDVLEARAGRGAAAVAAELFGKFRTSTSGVSTAGTYTTVVRRDRTRYLGDGWYLDVLADGTAGRYRNYTRIADAADARYGSSAKLDHTTLERQARDFVNTSLRGFVTVGTSEALVASHSAYRVDSISAEGTTAPPSESVAVSAVVFSRTIGGVSVVGPGSKVAVLFDATGAVAGFDFDWPTYAATGRAQTTLDVSATHGRARAVLPHDPFGPGRTLMRLECGYYDGGARKRGVATPIQPACVYHYTSMQVETDVTGARQVTRAAFAMALPVGSRVEADPKWRESLALCEGSTLCGTDSSAPAPVDAAVEPMTPSLD